jgi:oligopeptide transport system substrate-binding protein
MPAHSPGIGVPYDPQGARRLLDEAGLSRPGNLSLVRLSSWISADTVSNLQEQWQHNLGLETHWEQPQPSVPALQETLRTSAVHMFLDSWVADYPDPDDFLRVCVGSWHQTGWRNEGYKRLVQDARRCMDQGQRMRLYREADHILAAEAAIVPLTYGQKHLLLKPWVHLPLSPLRSMWHEVIIEPHQRIQGTGSTV